MIVSRASRAAPLVATLLVAAACSSASVPESTPGTVPSASPPAPTPAAAQSTSTSVPRTKVVFDADHTSDGLSLTAGGDVDTEVVAVGSPQEQAWCSGNGRILPSADGNKVQDWYMQFQIDDDFVFGGSPTSQVRIEVEFFDEGTDQFNLQYDAADVTAAENGRFKESEVVDKTDTRQFRTAVFELSDAFFGNRTNGADFRLSDLADGSETIRRVTVTLLTGGSEAAQSAGETPPATSDVDSDQPTRVIFHNGVVLTMEEDSEASAIAVEGERILDVGSDADILSQAGPGTMLIDLQGRTLMPGFVDAHNHVFNSIWSADQELGQAELLANGITTSAEMGAENDLVQRTKALDEAGLLRVRVSLYLLHVNACGEILGDWYSSSHPVSREPGAMLQIPGVKLFNDGGSCNSPAVSFDRVGVPGRGDLYFEVDELSRMVTAIQSLGYQVAIHGLGDRAIQVNLDAVENSLAGGPNLLHHRLEHNTLLRDEMLPRYTELDVVPTIFGSFPACWFASGNNTTPEEFSPWEWRWRSLIDTNPDVHFAWHSDAPSMGWDPVPLEHLHGFVTRHQTAQDGSVCEPPDWAVDDLLTVDEALKIMTIGSAYALLREDEIGSLKAGKLADLIILSDDPRDTDPDDLADIHVLMTMVGGEVQHCSPGQEPVCPGFDTP